MEFYRFEQATEGGHRVSIISDKEALDTLGLSESELRYARAAAAADQSLITLNTYNGFHFVQIAKENKEAFAVAESLRKAGAALSAGLKSMKISQLEISDRSGIEKAAFHYAQGLALAGYQFLKYRKDAAKLEHPLQRIGLDAAVMPEQELQVLNVLTEAAFRARDLVNEPLNTLGATELAAAIRALGEDAGFAVQTLGRDDIEREGMGGILAVNRGSIDPPSFSVMEYKPENPTNAKPIVLVGKGVVYDTGGLTLKPTPNSMDRMKSDMSGAALVSTAMWAAAKLKLPLHLIALVPATDNRPGENAYVPGDIITMYDGTTVEVLNTDAEGRMLLADALHWAKRYEPELVADFATLTGAASAAIGEHGIVCMGTAPEEVKSSFRNSGQSQYERLVEYPLWDEYGDQLKSEFADLKNIGGPTGGAITAGKFLQHFTDYPWMHFDIAGVSFNTGKKGYLPAGGTAYGLRMLLDFLMIRSGQ
jgi:leucyl aminopeptidase